MKTINNALIRSLTPCYDPSKYVTDEVETLSVVEWVKKYRGTVPDKDIIWLLCHEEFLSGKDLRLFALWCAREALKLVDNPDPRSVEACNVTERYVNGEAADAELEAAYSSVNADYAAARAADCVAAVAADCAVSVATYVDTYVAVAVAARAAQLDKLLTYFK